MKNGEKILACARQYVGLSEIISNAKWDNLSTPGLDPAAAKLLMKLKSVGWEPGWAYCIAFCELVLREAYEDQPVALEKVSRLMNPSVMSSYNNFSNAQLISRNPVPGSIFFMQNGIGGTGHAGIVEKVNPRIITNIEANTSRPRSQQSAARDREGDVICDGKERALNFTPSSGLHLRGFLNPF